MLIPWMFFLKNDEQILVEAFSKRFTVNGPASYLAPPLYSVTRRTGITLGPTDYIRVQDTVTGEVRNEYGPQLAFLDSTEIVVKHLKAMALKHNQFIKLIDKKSGVIRVERGEQSIYLQPTEEILENIKDGYHLDETRYLRVTNNLTGEIRNEFGPKLFFPQPVEEVQMILNIISLKKNQYIKIINNKTGVIRVERGEKSIFLEPTEEVLQNVSDGINLDETEYLRVQDNVTGSIRNELGPQLFIPGPSEEILGTLHIISLKHNQYVKVVDQKTGVIRVEKGEQSIVLTPYEKIFDEVSTGINVDEHTAVLIRDTKTGNLELITEPQVFFPTAQQDIVEVRERIRLEDHQTVVIKDENGRYQYRRGTDENRSFFLSPYSELVQFNWSTGLHKDARNLLIDRLDARPKFMWYEFDVRTRDNVELVLGVTFFWQISHVEKMVVTTDDVPGDICSHARSEIIQSVSKVTLETFLNQFNSIIRDAVTEREDSFYVNRGVDIHSVEVRSITCKEAGTQMILQEIIQETTNRLNRLQKQESENEVSLKQISGQIQNEEMRGKLIEIQSINEQSEAEMDGQAEALRVKAFLDGLGENLNSQEKLLIFNTLKKHEALTDLSKGSAQLFFTPEDVDLRIQTMSHNALRLLNPEAN